MYLYNKDTTKRDFPTSEWAALRAAQDSASKKPSSFIVVGAEGLEPPKPERAARLQRAGIAAIRRTQF